MPTKEPILSESCAYIPIQSISDQFMEFSYQNSLKFAHDFTVSLTDNMPPDAPLRKYPKPSTNSHTAPGLEMCTRTSLNAPVYFYQAVLLATDSKRNSRFPIPCATDTIVRTVSSLWMIRLWDVSITTQHTTVLLHSRLRCPGLRLVVAH